ncbi:alpha/beta hydrolase [Nocardia pseudobrasiliensis]|uniref:Alpha/beta hydrolase family protein n=1 Tax=Nocardia pseudobrasiliensis TaxID=45979 RepID=A0A370I1Y5_9NOCA|nr:alpha/beta hydrolase [Nocardia pseudobrasiliensis]RDI64590.1 alpha/beta hydrolase family protein [Nocardia pseudobrasiliensis]
MTTTTLAYGSHPDQVADLYLPENASAPLILLLHGGFWRQRVGREYATGVARALVAGGAAVANIEYRRAGGDGGWPLTFTDVAAALDSLPELVETAAPGRIDRTRIVAVGHSAGGHLALWAMLRHRLPSRNSWFREELPPIAGIVALAPVTDLAEAYRLGSGEDAVAEFLGGGPDRFGDRYAVAEPITLGPVPVPVIVVHGELDQRVPVEMSRDYCAKTGAELVELAGVDHFQLMDPDSPAWPAVRAEIDRAVP